MSQVNAPEVKQVPQDLRDTCLELQKQVGSLSGRVVRSDFNHPAQLIPKLHGLINVATLKMQKDFDSANDDTKLQSVMELNELVHKVENNIVNFEEAAHIVTYSGFFSRIASLWKQLWDRSIVRIEAPAIDEALKQSDNVSDAILKGFTEAIQDEIGDEKDFENAKNDNWEICKAPGDNPNEYVMRHKKGGKDITSKLILTPFGIKVSKEVDKGWVRSIIQEEELKYYSFGTFFKKELEEHDTVHKLKQERYQELDEMVEKLRSSNETESPGQELVLEKSGEDYSLLIGANTYTLRVTADGEIAVSFQGKTIASGKTFNEVLENAHVTDLKQAMNKQRTDLEQTMNKQRTELEEDLNPIYNQGMTYEEFNRLLGKLGLSAKGACLLERREGAGTHLFSYFDGNGIKQYEIDLKNISEEENFEPYLKSKYDVPKMGTTFLKPETLVNMESPVDALIDSKICSHKAFVGDGSSSYTKECGSLLKTYGQIYKDDHPSIWFVSIAKNQPKIEFELHRETPAVVKEKRGMLERVVVAGKEILREVPKALRSVPGMVATATVSAVRSGIKGLFGQTPLFPAYSLIVVDKDQQTKEYLLQVKGEKLVIIEDGKKIEGDSLEELVKALHQDVVAYNGSEFQDIKQDVLAHNLDEGKAKDELISIQKNQIEIREKLERLTNEIGKVKSDANSLEFIQKALEELSKLKSESEDIKSRAGKNHDHALNLASAIRGKSLNHIDDEISPVIEEDATLIDQAKKKISKIQYDISLLSIKKREIEEQAKVAAHAEKKPSQAVAASVKGGDAEEQFRNDLAKLGEEFNDLKRLEVYINEYPSDIGKAQSEGEVNEIKSDIEKKFATLKTLDYGAYSKKIDDLERKANTENPSNKDFIISQLKLIRGNIPKAGKRTEDFSRTKKDLLKSCSARISKLKEPPKVAAATKPALATGKSRRQRRRGDDLAIHMNY